MNVSAALSARLLIARATAATGQDARRRRGRLEHELAGYHSSADQQDLDALLEQYPDDATAEFREILAHQSLVRGQKHVHALTGRSVLGVRRFATRGLATRGLATRVSWVRVRAALPRLAGASV